MIFEKAYAKINLFLDVCKRCENGFHEIKTVMHSLTLSDELLFEITPSDTTEIKLSVIGDPTVPTGEENLVCRAVKKYLSESGKSAKVSVRLTKNIPSSAGLAGGSSDAAATLRALNRHFGCFSDGELLRLGLSLGSDLPYCIAGGTALCRGRGEKITSVNSPGGYFFVVAIGDEKISAGAAYSALDLEYSNFDGTIKSEGEALFDKFSSELSKGILSAQTAFNIFEKTVAKSAPSVYKIKETFSECRASYSLMSGSGPSVFGVFEDEASARNAEKKLNSLGYRAYFCKSVN